MTGLHYPDNLYADHEERKARRSQAPTGAYRAPTEMPESERKLRTALAYVNHARDLIREALGDNGKQGPCEVANLRPGEAYSSPEDRVKAWGSERVPKWDPKWVETCPQRASHPMHAETLRDHDERLVGGESHL